MRNRLNMFGLPVASFAVVMMFNTVNAAESGRAAYNVSRLNRVGMSASQRMPTMPTLPINTTGNMSIDLPSVPTPVVPDEPVAPDEPVVPDDPVAPDEPTPECPDGGVKDSEYTVNDCMRDVYSCVNNSGILPNGINDLFNEELRNSIINGMGLCMVQVERCVREVRRNCENIYHSTADVWIDFNTRRVQPEYYSFVLRKTGLTPRQAENTCWLLDKNTYGKSFDAVANSGLTTYEYNNPVGAYNGQGGAHIVKKNPQGVKLNNGNPGVDGSRGHYARWDAASAECYIRVGAYNKDTPIKNSWLFGAVGDDRLAETWTTAGSVFTCNKDPFGFSLYKDTSTVAVVGVGGGTLLGAGIGAMAGHGAREFDCNNDEHREKLMDALKKNNGIAKLNARMFADDPLPYDSLTAQQCNAIVERSVARDRTTITGNIISEFEGKFSFKCTINDTETTYTDGGNNITDDEWTKCKSALELYKAVAQAAVGEGEIALTSSDVEYTVLAGLDEVLQGEKGNRGKTTLAGAAIGAGAGGLATAITALVEKNNINCRLGDGLDQIGYGKSMHVGTLRDFYVKWNLRLPENVAPTSMVVDCNSWRRACSEITDLEQCKAAQVNYKPDDAPAITLVHAACIPSGSVCIENYPVAKSYGACLPPATPDDDADDSDDTQSGE